MRRKNTPGHLGLPDNSVNFYSLEPGGVNLEAQQQSLKNANTSFEWLMQSGELGDLCLLFNFDMVHQGWEQLIFRKESWGQVCFILVTELVLECGGLWRLGICCWGCLDSTDGYSWENWWHCLWSAEPWPGGWEPSEHWGNRPMAGNRWCPLGWF